MIAGQKPMTRAEIAEEAKWLLDGGLHVTRIAAALDRTTTAIARAARHVGDASTARPFEAWTAGEVRVANPGKDAARARDRRARAKVAA